MPMPYFRIVVVFFLLLGLSALGADDRVSRQRLDALFANLVSQDKGIALAAMTELRRAEFDRDMATTVRWLLNVRAFGLVSTVDESGYRFGKPGDFGNEISAKFGERRPGVPGLVFFGPHLRTLKLIPGAEESFKKFVKRSSLREQPTEDVMSRQESKKSDRELVLEDDSVVKEAQAYLNQKLESWRSIEATSAAAHDALVRLGYSAVDSLIADYHDHHSVDTLEVLKDIVRSQEAAARVSPTERIKMKKLLYAFLSDSYYELRNAPSAW